MKPFKLIIWVFAFILVLNGVYAHNVEIDLNKKLFGSGEEIILGIKVKNEESKQVTFDLDLGIAHEDGLFFFERVHELITLEALEERELSYSFIVEEFVAPGDYDVDVVLWEQTKKVFVETDTIEIVGTDKEFEFSIRICKDSACRTESKTFIGGETIYLDYLSDIKNIEIDSILVYPDKTTQEVTLPTTIIAGESGTYELQATASKAGYRTVSTKSQFGVIEKQAEIQSVSVCKVNGVCDGEENRQNCPQDCKSGENDGFCDKEMDGKCDPDCRQEEDQDCYLSELKVEPEEVKIEREEEKDYTGKIEIPVAIGVIALITFIFVFYLVYSQTKKK